MNEMFLLAMSAATLGVVHTILGPDHYLPFIVLSRARNWSRSKTLWITVISGVGHVGSSIILGIVGIAMGISLHKLEAIEANRGNIVGWMLIVFGLIYTGYGIYKYMNNGAHLHLFNFLLPKKIRHRKLYDSEESEKGDDDAGKITPWILFLIFIFGPCEVLIPMLIYPAAENSHMGIFMVALVFGLATVLTMSLVVMLGYKGVSLIKLNGKEHVFHLVAGLVILLSGVSIQFLGL